MTKQPAMSNSGLIDRDAFNHCTLQAFGQRAFIEMSVVKKAPRSGPDNDWDQRLKAPSSRVARAAVKAVVTTAAATVLICLHQAGRLASLTPRPLAPMGRERSGRGDPRGLGLCSRGPCQPRALVATPLSLSLPPSPSLAPFLPISPSLPRSL